MGKTNKANRTKGNTRPSSSGHSALLLSSNGKGLPGFVGFSSLDKEIASYVPVTGQQTSDIPDATVDSDFRMVMRKILKRDAVTRLKAVQEFGDYCTEKEQDIVKSVLPFWPRLFNKLSLDTDRRIREATHLANGKLLSKVGREMAPYLRSIMGVWLLGQMDPHPPAASAATSAFGLFSSTKQAEALVFCKNEVFSYFKDNLFEHTVKSVSEPHPTSPEEMENKYCLVISSTLQALKLFITSIEINNCTSIEKDLQSFVSENKFWKFSKHKEPLIRSSWYSLVACLCQNIHTVFASIEKKLMISVFGCLAESDPVVAPPVWEAALSIVAKFENCWDGIDIQKIVLPQLWSLLEEGGKGNARLLYPCLLPFLTRLPPQLIQKEEFLLRFFSCFHKSLKLDKVKASVMDCDAILSAFIECLLYMACSKLSYENGASLFEKVFLSEIFPIMQSALLHPKDSPIATSNFYPLIGTVLRRLERTKSVHQSYSRVLDIFWENTLSITSNLFDLEESRKQNTAMYLLYFYNCVINALVGNTIQEKKSVRFKDEDNENENTADADPPCNQVSSFSLLNKNSKSFFYIAKACQLLFERLNENCNLCYVKLLDEIVNACASKELVEEIIHLLGYDPNYPTDFYKKTLAKWSESDKFHHNDMITGVVDFTFVLCSCFNIDDAVNVLDACSETSLHCVEKVLEVSLKNYKNVTFAANFLETSTCWQTELVKNIQVSIESHVPDVEKISAVPALLKICCSSSYLCDIMLKKGTFNQLIELLNEFTDKVLQSGQCEFSDPAGQFLCSVVAYILKNAPHQFWKVNDSHLLVLKLFEYSTIAWSLIYSSPLKSLLSKTWEAALTSYICSSEKTSEENFILKIVSCLHNEILNLESDNQLMHILNHCKSILTVLSNEKTDSALCSTLLSNLLLSEEEWLKLKDGLHIDTLPSLIKGNIFYPLEEINPYKPELANQITRLNLISQLTAEVVFSECISVNENDNVSCQEIVQLQIPYLLWSLSFFENDITTKEPTEEKYLSYENVCRQIVCTLSTDGLINTTENLFTMSLSQDSDWAFPFQILLDWHPETVNSLWSDTLILSNSKHKYFTLQLLMCHFSENILEQILCQSVSALKENKNSTDMEHFQMICCCLANNSNLPKQSIMDVLSEIYERDKALKSEIDSKSINHTFLLTFSYLSLCSTIDFSKWKYFTNVLNTWLEADILSEVEHSRASVFRLYQSLTLFCKLVKASNQCGGQYTLDQKIYHKLAKFFLHILDLFTKKKTTACLHLVLPLLYESVKFIPSNVLFDVVSKVTFLTEQPSQNASFTLVLEGLKTSNKFLQFGSHSILCRIMKELPLVLESTKVPDGFEEYNKLPTMLVPLVEYLVYMNEMVESMLQSIQIGQACTILPHTDSYNIAMGYMLACANILELIGSSSGENHLKYVTHLKEIDLFSKIFTNIFCLLPDDPLACVKKISGSNTVNKDCLKLLFVSPLEIFPGPASSEGIQAVACFVYASSLRKVPAAVRSWWNNLERKYSDIVNDYTAQFISGYLCGEEFEVVQNNENLFDDMVVHARLSTREVTAKYTLDDRVLELSVKLPINHPLGRVQCDLKSVISQAQRQEWIMQLALLLTHQNGSILDGLQMWKRNLEEKFKGVEECMICFQILEMSTGHLPKISCAVCHKKFHSHCIYKWFQTSNKNSCPLCRQEYMM